MKYNGINEFKRVVCKRDLPEVRYSLRKGVYYLCFESRLGKRRRVEFREIKDMERDSDVKELCEWFYFGEEVLRKARERAKGNLKRKRGGKYNLKWYEHVGFVLPVRGAKKKRTKVAVSEEAYQRALNNSLWALKMKEKGYGTLAEYLENRKVVCEHDGVKFNEERERDLYKVG